MDVIIIIAFFVLGLSVFLGFMTDRKNIRTAGLKVLTIFAYSWLYLVFFSILFSIIGVLIKTGSVINTIQWSIETFSPFNVINYIVILVVSLPAIVAFYIRKKIEERSIQ